MATNLFIADLHLGISESNLYRMGRPFSSPEQHDEAIIDHLNSALSHDWTNVWVVGDFADSACSLGHFVECARAVENNRKLHLISGNHDEYLLDRCKEKGIATFGDDGLFGSVYETTRLNVDGKRVKLSHMPYATPVPGGYCIHGHLHDAFADPTNPYARCSDFVKTLPTSLNANCELTGYKPVTFTELVAINERWRLS